MSQAIFRFYADLNDFLPRDQRQQPVTYNFSGRASVKDMIEAIGVPHPEVALITREGAPLDFGTIVQDGDRLAVYPLFRALEMTPREDLLIPPLPDPRRFVLDVHLGRLVAYLRMMGFDALFPENINDDYLAQLAHDEHRIMLTRDQGLLKRKIVIFGYWVRATDPEKQLREIVRRFDLAPRARPFERCAHCNTPLRPVDKAAILDRLEPGTARYYDEFRICPACDRVYWKGPHVARLEALFAEITARRDHARRDHARRNHARGRQRPRRGT